MEKSKTKKAKKIVKKKATKRKPAKYDMRASVAKRKKTIADRKRAQGRPLTYESAEDIQTIISIYFAAVKHNMRILQGVNPDIPTYENPNHQQIFDDVDTENPTMTGLAMALGMNRASLLNYGRKESFFSTIEKAKQKVEINLENRLARAAPVGTIFSLKNNCAWNDGNKEAELETPAPINVSITVQDGKISKDEE